MHPDLVDRALFGENQGCRRVGNRDFNEGRDTGVAGIPISERETDCVAQTFFADGSSGLRLSHGSGNSTLEPMRKAVGDVGLFSKTGEHSNDLREILDDLGRGSGNVSEQSVMRKRNVSHRALNRLEVVKNGGRRRTPTCAKASLRWRCDARGAAPRSAE
ncbi:hypothetical protein AAFG07_32810 [Bradyrhizobium sp. B097]|uniref:hypothetical protein n=1 Tax=Bradyrhizobium sp. B097 TaxID=3140244 RepID=UPI0031838BE3